MRYQKNPLFVTVQDKYKVREYAAAKGVKTADLLYVTDQPDDIPFTELPDQYMIKASHGCGWNILYYDSKFYKFGNGKNVVNTDGSFPTQADSNQNVLTEAEVVETCQKWLSRTYTKIEWAYPHIPPKILIEELLATEKDQPLFEYKIFTYRGIPKAIFATTLKYRKANEIALFDHTFTEIILTERKHQVPNPLPKKPDNFSEILNIASALGEDFDCVRVDLYNTAKGVVLGELTLYTEGGNPRTPTHCPVFNQWLGDQWILSKADTRKAILWNIRFNLTSPIKTAIIAVRSNLRPLFRRISGKIKSYKTIQDSHIANSS